MLFPYLHGGIVGYIRTVSPLSRYMCLAGALYIILPADTIYSRDNCICVALTIKALHL